MAFGKRGYYFMAYNIAFSIRKHDPDIKIHLIVDDKKKLASWIGTKINYFDSIVEIDSEDLFNKGKLDPGLAKLSIYKYLPFDHNIYLDVDAIAIKSIKPLIELLVSSGKSYLSQCIGYHTIDQGDLIDSMQWAKAGVVWKHFKLSKKAILPAINSSIAYILKSDESCELFNTAREFFLNPMDQKDLSHKWGGTQPDELYMNAALAKHGIDPSMGIIPIHFEIPKRKTFDQVLSEYYIQGYYGGRGFIHKMYTQWVDDLLRKWHKDIGQDHAYTMSTLLDDKHANKR